MNNDFPKRDAQNDAANKDVEHGSACPGCGENATVAGELESPPGRSHSKLVSIVVILLVIAILGMLLEAAFSRAREVKRNVQCQGRLAQIAQAVRTYTETYGSFPPAYVADKDGNPLYSWRVLILPFMGHRDLYRKFHLTERWDSKNNKAISDLAMDVFQCPSQPNNNQATTNYMMVVGDHTISNGAQSKKPNDITDGMANTIMLVEVADSTTWWAEPDDLDINTMNFTVNGGKKNHISSYHDGGANVVFCDGPVKFLRDSINPQLVKALITIDGGENTKEK